MRRDDRQGRGAHRADRDDRDDRERPGDAQSTDDHGERDERNREGAHEPSRASAGFCRRGKAAAGPEVRGGGGGGLMRT